MMAGYKNPERLGNAYSVQMACFEPERFMQLIMEHQCNSMAAVPTMLILMLNHPKVDQYDLSSLKEVVCGAAPLSVEVHFVDDLPRSPVGKVLRRELRTLIENNE